MASTATTKPTHDVYFVKEPMRDNQKAYWDRIGAAWPHKDQAGLNVQLDFMPVDMSKGRIVIRVRTERPDAGTEPLSTAEAHA